MNRKLDEQSFFGNKILTDCTTWSRQTCSGHWMDINWMKQPCVSHLCFIAGVVSYLIVVKKSCRKQISNVAYIRDNYWFSWNIRLLIMSSFIHHFWGKPFPFMLILVGHDERNFSLQINITKDSTSILQRKKDIYIIISFWYINTIAYCILIDLQY